MYFVHLFDYELFRSFSWVFAEAFVILRPRRNHNDAIKRTRIPRLDRTHVSRIMMPLKWHRPRWRIGCHPCRFSTMGCSLHEFFLFKVVHYFSDNRCNERRQNRNLLLRREKKGRKRGFRRSIVKKMERNGGILLWSFNFGRYVSSARYLGRVQRNDIFRISIPILHLDSISFRYIFEYFLSPADFAT